MAVARSNREVARARPLIYSYWFMPVAAAVAVLLTAIGMLTEVVILAHRIDENVNPIVASTHDIKLHTDTIAVLNTVDANAKQIRQAADPLSGQANTILGTVGVINTTVGAIDGQTGSIDSHASGIDSTVASITPHVLLIAEPAESIRAQLGGTTTPRLAQILGLLQNVLNDTHQLAGSLVPSILNSATAIDQKLP